MASPSTLSVRQERVVAHFGVGIFAFGAFAAPPEGQRQVQPTAVARTAGKQACGDTHARHALREMSPHRAQRAF